MSIPLEGINILDMTHFQAGPSATQLLAWLGANVIKIEEPLIGDKARIEMSDDDSEDSFYFKLFNSNKKSICLDIKSSLGQKIFKELVSKCDVLVENFAPGYMKKFGIDYENLKNINPKLIYASIKGYGSKGENSDFKSFEGVAQASSGIMGTNGEPNGDPLIVSAGVSDSGSGLHCVIGILSAIINRSKTNEGDFIDISMQDSSLNLNRMKMINTLKSNLPEPRIGNLLRGQPSIFKCHPDGYYDYVYICIGGESWHTFLAIIGRSDLIFDLRFDSESSRKNYFSEIKDIIEKKALKGDINAVAQLAKWHIEVLEEPDHEGAYTWFAVAAALNIEGAAKNRDTSKEFLESEQITDLQKKAAGIFSGINEAIILKQEREGES